MPAQSQQQQKLFGLALSVKRGDTPRSDASQDVLDIVDSMTQKEIEDFAGTEHSGLPKKVESQLRGVVREIMRERVLSEAAGKEAMGIAAFTGTRGDAVQKFIDDNKLDAKKLFNYVKGGKLTDRLNFVTAIVGTPGNPVQKRMIKMFGESINEGKFKVDDLVYNKRTKTVGIVRMGDDKYGEVKTDADGNVSVDELEKYNPIKFKHQTKAKVAPSTQKEVNSRGLFNPFKAESVNEEKYPIAVEKFNKELIKHPMVKKAADFYKKTPAEIVKVLQQRLYTKGDKTGNTKEVYIDFKDTTSGITIKHKMKFNESLESVNEASYNFGKEEYTKKNMTPTQILDLAMGYVQTPITKLVGKTLGHRVNVANDLSNLTGTTQLDATKRGKSPALVLFLLKNSLVTKDEYVKLYKDLVAKHQQVIKYLKNASPEMRGAGGAARAAAKDMRGEFEMESKG